MRNRPLVVKVCLLLLAVGVGYLFGSLARHSDPKGKQWQKVNNSVALQDVDQRLATMSGPEKAHYLAFRGCAADMAIAGVYGSVESNPLMQLSNELNDRYNLVYKQVGTVVAIPASLAAAEDEVCPGDHPVG